MLVKTSNQHLTSRTGLINTRRAILSRSLGGFQKPKGIYETASSIFHQ
jgi:hypothetical protein